MPAINRQRHTKQAAERRGRRAEDMAVWLLRLKGYRILARRLRTPASEIDIVARRRNLIVIVEVKGRKSVDAAVAAVPVRQQQRLAMAAAWLPNWDAKLTGLDIRFDVIAVAPGAWPRHIENAWMRA